MVAPDLFQQLVAERASGRLDKALSLTALNWHGSCVEIIAEGDDDDDLVGTYSQEGGPRPLRLASWSDEHLALVYQPLSPVRFDYTRDDVVGQYGSNTTEYGDFAGEPEEHGPLFYVHRTAESPYQRIGKRPPFHFYVRHYKNDYDDELAPQEFLTGSAPLLLPDLAAEAEAKANNVHDEEEPEFVDLYGEWADSVEPDSTIREGWCGPWARDLIARARQHPGQPLGTTTAIAWAEDFGVDLSLETINVHAEDLIEPDDIKDIAPESPIQRFQVIDRYTIRANVLRVLVKPSFFSPASGIRESAGVSLRAGDERQEAQGDATTPGDSLKRLRPEDDEAPPGKKAKP